LVSFRDLDIDIEVVHVDVRDVARPLENFPNVCVVAHDARP